MTPSLRERASARIPALLRDQSFRRYWNGQTISMFGDQISWIALPLTGVIALHATPAQMGFLAALVWLPSLLFGLHAGAWVDRRGHRRRTMITADIARALLLTSVPVCWAAGEISHQHILTMWQLYGVAFTVGTFSVLFTVSNPSLFVALVPKNQYMEGQSLVYGSRALSFVGGPSVGGVLVQLLTAPFAVLADAVSFIGSAFFLARIKPDEPPVAREGEATLMAGARFIARTPIMRVSLAAASVVNFFNFVFFALFVLYATRYLHVRPGVLGLVLGLGAVGGLLGAAVTKRLGNRFGAGWVYTLSFLVFAAPMALVPAAAGPHWLILTMLLGSEFVSGFGVMVLDITGGAIYAAVIPDELRSRVTGAFQAVNYGTRPLGALAGGLLGTWLGPRPTLWIAAIGGCLSFLVMLPTSVPRFRMPQEPAAVTDPQGAVDRQRAASSSSAAAVSSP